MAATQSLTGKAGSMTLGNTVVPITKADPKTMFEFADATDSGNFAPAAGSHGTLYKSQRAGDTQVEISIEGYYDKATTPSVVLAKLLDPDAGPWPMTVNFDQTTVYFTGNVDIYNVDTSMTIPGANMISFTATAKSNGAYSLI